MNQTLHEIMIIVATWKTLTPTKYTMHLMEGVDELELKAVMLKSAIENICENPEETYPINVQTTYDRVAANSSLIHISEPMRLWCISFAVFFVN